MKYHIYLYNKAGAFSFNREFDFVIPNVIDGSDFIGNSGTATEINAVTWRRLFMKYFSNFMKSSYGFLAIPEGDGCTELRWTRSDQGVNKHMSALTDYWPIIAYNFDLTAYDADSPMSLELLTLIVGSNGFRFTWNNGVDPNIGGLSTTLVESSNFIGSTMTSITCPFLPFKGRDLSNYPPYWVGRLIEIPSDLTATDEALKLELTISTGSTRWSFSNDDHSRYAINRLSVQEIIPVGLMATQGGNYNDTINPLAALSSSSKNSQQIGNNIIYSKR